MKIVVFNYGKSKTATSSKKLAQGGVDHIALFHTQAEADEYVRLGTVKERYVHVTNAPEGNLSIQRNAALDLAEEGEWICFLSDDLRHVSALGTYDEETSDVLHVDKKDANATAVLGWMFDTRISFSNFVSKFPEQIIKAEERGAHLIGFSAFSNPFFRFKKFMYGGFCDGKLTINKKCHLRYDEQFKLLDDWSWSCIHMREFGTLLINQWLCPDFSCTAKSLIKQLNQLEAYHKGTADKMPCVEKNAAVYFTGRYYECKQLIDTYPEWAIYADKFGWPSGTNIRILKKPKEQGAR